MLFSGSILIHQPAICISDVVVISYIVVEDGSVRGAVNQAMISEERKTLLASMQRKADLRRREQKPSSECNTQSYAATMSLLQDKHKGVLFTKISRRFH